MKKKIKKIGFVSEFNPFTDKTAWSGLMFKIREGIENAGFEVIWIDCKINGKIGKIFKLLCQLLHGKKIMFGHTYSHYRLMNLYINKSQINKCDLLFFPGGAPILKYLRTSIPSIYYSDATFSLMYGYYWPSLNFSKWQYKTGNSLEQIGIMKSRINIRASFWAAQSVWQDYSFDRNHTYVLRFGANLDETDMLQVKPYNGDGVLNVLFSGVDWERKGGETAIETVRILNNMGIKSNLFIIGVKTIPSKYYNYNYIKFIGYLNKTIPEQYSKYLEAIRQCNILLLPTRAECAGVVFCEASAFGMPIYTYNTGGISDYVLEGVNGFMLDPSAGSENFANTIANSISSTKQKELSLNCRKIYEEKLNWNVWSENFKDIISKEF